MAAPNCELSLYVIEEIFYWIPPKSLLRLKLTCKEWYNLINDNRFICNHIDLSSERFIRNDNGQEVQILDPVNNIRSFSAMPNEFRGLHRLYKMVHCDGLMLCTCVGLRFTGTTLPSLHDLKQLVVWNPFLRKFKWIEPKTRYCGTDSFGIGYNKNSRGNYKILRLSLAKIEDKSNAEYEIYEPVKSDSWRSIDANFDGAVELDCEGVSVKGNMYWIAVKKKTIRFILSFDFSTETFQETCVCPTNGNERLGCFNGDKLSLLQQDETRKIHVWVTNKLSDRSVSFSKYLDVDFPNLPVLRTHPSRAHPGYFIGKQRNIMAWCEIDVRAATGWYVCIILFEIDEGRVRQRIETRRFHYVYFSNSIRPTCSYVYVPSLMPVPRYRGRYHDCS